MRSLADIIQQTNQREIQVVQATAEQVEQLQRTHRVQIIHSSNLIEVCVPSHQNIARN